MCSSEGTAAFGSCSSGQTGSKIEGELQAQELLGVKPVWWAAGSKEYPLSLQTLTALEFLPPGCA